MKFIRAKSISYSADTRPYSSVRAIVLHYTGNKGDTAVGNCRYFASGNTRAAGAHIFVDQKGGICKSVPLSRAAWSVGLFFTRANGAAKYWGDLNNYNTVSIEMCDCATKDPSKKTIKAIKKAIKYIRKYCPNAKKIVRHWDICGKSCPTRMIGAKGTKGYERWNKLLIDLGEKKKITKKSKTNGNGNTDPLGTVQVTAKDGLNVRKGYTAEYAKVKTLKYKAKVKYYQKRNGWLRIGKARWINGYYTKKVKK